MLYEKIVMQTCCGTPSHIYKIDRPITKDLLNKFVDLGFKEVSHFTQAGILYVDNLDFILTGPIGSDRLQVKCKAPNCYSKIEVLEAQLQQIG